MYPGCGAALNDNETLTLAIKGIFDKYLHSVYSAVGLIVIMTLFLWNHMTPPVTSKTSRRFIQKDTISITISHFLGESTILALSDRKDQPHYLF